MLDTEQSASDIGADNLIVVALFVGSVQRASEAKVSFEFLDLLAPLLWQDRAACRVLVKTLQILSKPPASLTRGAVLQCSAFLSVGISTGSVSCVSADAIISVPLATRTVTGIHLGMANSLELVNAAWFGPHISIRESSGTAGSAVHDTAEIDFGRFEGAGELVLCVVCASLERACVC